VYVESTELRPRIRVSADLITYGFGPQTAGAFENTRTYAEVLQDWRGWLREGILDTAILMDYKRDTLTTGGNDQRRMYAEWSDFAKDNQFRRSAVIGAGLYINDIASSARQARVALAPSPSGNSAIGWAGYSYRTPDDLTDNGTRSGAASRVELIKALTAPSQYDAVAPPVFAETKGVPGMAWKVNPLFDHIKAPAPGPEPDPDAAAGRPNVPVERRPRHPAAREDRVRRARVPRVVVRPIGVSDALPGRARDRGRRLLQQRDARLGRGEARRGRVPRY